MNTLKLIHSGGTKNVYTVLDTVLVGQCPATIFCSWHSCSTSRGSKSGNAFELEQAVMDHNALSKSCSRPCQATMVARNLTLQECGGNWPACLLACQIHGQNSF